MAARRMRSTGMNNSKGGGAKNGMQFFLESDSLTSGVHRIGPFVDKFVKATLAYYEPQVENAARKNASWTDRTSNARNGLIARSGREGNEHFLVLAHRVPYGIWLEVRFSGKYAIIMPTLSAYGPKIMGTLENILRRLESQGGVL